MSDLHETERERFEAWAHSIMLIRVDWMENGEYVLLAANDCWQAWKARAALAPAVPPGYVLVPVEPTAEMREAGHKAWMKSTLAALEADPGPEVDGPRSNLAAAYRSMCAAAPSAKEQTP